MDAKNDLKMEPNAPFCDAVETQNVGPDIKRPLAEVGAMDDVAVDSVAAPTITAPTIELRHEHHAANGKGVATVDVVVDHIPASIDNSNSKDKGSYDSIFTLTQIERTTVCISNIQSQNLVFSDL